MASWWKFRCFVDEDGVDLIDQWYQAQPPKLRAKFDARLRFLQQQPRSNWVRPYFDTLKDECAGLGEVRFEWKNVQYRPIGFASGEMEFTFVFVAKEQGGTFVPKSACSTSQRRKAAVRADRRRARDCEVE